MNLYKLSVLADTLMILKVNDKLTLKTLDMDSDTKVIEPIYDIVEIQDLATVLAEIRETNPALYMRGVTTDMIVEYT